MLYIFVDGRTRSVNFTFLPCNVYIFIHCGIAFGMKLVIRGFFE